MCDSSKASNIICNLWAFSGLNRDIEAKLLNRSNALSIYSLVDYIGGYTLYEDPISAGLLRGKLGYTNSRLVW